MSKKIPPRIAKGLKIRSLTRAVDDAYNAEDSFSEGAFATDKDMYPAGDMGGVSALVFYLEELKGYLQELKSLTGDEKQDVKSACLDILESASWRADALKKTIVSIRKAVRSA